MPAKGDPGAYISARLKPGDVVIDVGANEGVYARQFAEKVAPTGTVIALEPDPRCHELLDGVPCLSAVSSAVGPVNGTKAFHQAPMSQQSSCHRAAVPELLHTISVPVLTLDTVADTAAAVKIDAQGGESGILRGATRLLRSCPLWVIELWPWGLRQAGETPESVVQPFVDAGLSPRYMSDEDPIPTPEQLIAYCELTQAPNEHINVAWVRA